MKDWQNEKDQHDHDPTARTDRLRLAEDNCLSLDAYRFDTLDYLYEIAVPASIAEVP